MNLDEVSFVGKELVRPECVLATKAGNLYSADFRGGVSQISSDGSPNFFGGAEYRDYGKLKPNGIAMLKDGSFLIAHLGAERGGVFRLTREGNISEVLTHVDGEHLPPTNFVYLDFQGRIWITVSTKTTPRSNAYRSDIKDGFIVLMDEYGARVVADGIGYTNELYVSRDGRSLFVNATFSRELLSFDVGLDGALTNRKTLCTFGHGIYPDGLTMDSEGFLWVASIISNRVLRVDPRTGAYKCMLEDFDSEHVERVERAFLSHSIGRPELDGIKSKKLKNISSLAFSGSDLKKMTLGCLLGDELAQIDGGVAGMPPAHWEFES